MDIDKIIREKGGIRLDIACGENRQPHFVGMDMRPLPGVDIVHDLNIHPWPLPDNCAMAAVASHIVEHIPAVAIRADGSTWFPFLAFMDEVWRILKPAGKFAIATPHGHSQGFRQDPTHINAMDEGTFCYFDPEHPALMWTVYKPKPWKIVNLTWSPVGNIECVLEKREDVYE